MVVGELLRTAVFPTVVSACIALIGGGFLSHSGKAKDVWQAIGLATGFVVGFVPIAAFVFPPVQIVHWLPLIAGFSALVFALAHFFGGKARYVLGSLALFAVPWITLNPFFKRWTSGQVVVSVVVLGLAAGILYGSRWKTENHAPVKSAYWVLIIAATGMSLTHLLDGGAMSGQIGGAFAAACGGLFLASLFGKGISLGPATLGVYSAIFSALAILGYFYVEVSPVAILLVYCSALSLWMFYKPLGASSRLKHIGFRLTLAILPVAIAIILLLIKASEDSYGGY